MKLADIFDSLASGELNTLSCVENGVVNPEHYARVIRGINRGLVKITTRLTLYKDFVILETNPDLSTYVIDDTHTLSSGNPDPYILDTVTNPYQNNLIEILSLVSSENRRINLDGSDGVVRTALNRLQFKGVVPEGTFVVEYSALPQLVSLDDLDNLNPSMVEVQLPLVCLNALVYFVASLFYSPTLSGMDGVRASLDVNYIQKYEAECLLLETRGIDIDEALPTNLFSQRGFV